MQRIPCPLQTWAGATPDAPAIRSTAETISYRTLDARVSAAMTWLESVGVGAQSRVVLVLPVNSDYIALLWALYRLGAVACPINPAIPPMTQAQMAADIVCTHWIGQDSTTATVAPQGCTVCDFPDACLDAFSTNRPGLICLDRDAPSTLVFTSGSTGRPKGALLSFRNLQVNAIRSNRNLPFYRGDNWLLSLPLYHVSGLGILFRSFIAGGSVTLLTAPQDIGSALSQGAITHLSLVATQLHRLLESPETIGELRSLRGILLGGSAIPASLIHRAAVLQLPIYTTYGLTECASQVCTTPPDTTLNTLLSSGKALHSDTLHIAGNGEIMVGGETLFLGYLLGQDIQRPLTPEGYFPTGDLGYLDEAGYLHVTGRIDNRFIAGGENIQPEEIEAVLNQLPGVMESVVVPIPHERFGNTPVAFVRMAPQQELNPEQCKASLATKLPKFKIPRHFLPWPKALQNRQTRNSGIKIARPRFAEAARKALME